MLGIFQDLSYAEMESITSSYDWATLHCADVPRPQASGAERRRGRRGSVNPSSFSRSRRAGTVPTRTVTRGMKY